MRISACARNVKANVSNLVNTAAVRVCCLLVLPLAVVYGGLFFMRKRPLLACMLEVGRKVTAASAVMVLARLLARGVRAQVSFQNASLSSSDPSVFDPEHFTFSMMARMLAFESGSFYGGWLFVGTAF